MNEELQAIIEEMVRAGESEENIALVIQNYQAPQSLAQQPTQAPALPEPTFEDNALATIGGFNRGVGQVISAPLKLVGAGGNFLQSVATGQDVDPNSGMFTQAGQAVEDFFEKYNPRYENVNQTLQSVGEGLGQGVGMIATAGLGAASRAGQIAEMAVGPTSLLGATGQALAKVGRNTISPTGFVGGSMTAVPEWEAAKEAGLSDEEAFQTLLKNYLVGQTEAIPIERLMVGLNRITGGKILETVKLMGQQGLTEGTQEAIQTYLTNEIAKADYDPDRDPLFQVLESAKVGGIVGFILPGVMSIAQNSSPEKRVKLERKLGELQADEIINEIGDTGDPALNAEIDAAAQIDPVDKQVLEEVKVAEAVQEEQKEIEAEEKLQKELGSGTESTENAENTKSNTAEEAEIPISQTPEYKEALDKVTKLKEQFEALPIDETADQLLFDLREARQALQKIAGKPKDNRKKTDIQKQIEDATGVTKPEKSVKMTPNEAIKHQVQTFFRGMDKGVKKGKELSNELVAKVQEAIKDSPLKPKQISSILNRVKNTNLFTPGSISRLNNFIDKVTQDAEYADKLGEAKSLNKKLRKLSKSSSSNLQNYKTLARSFASINPEDTFINPHLEMGNKILQALTSPTSEKYAPVDVAEAQAYVTDLQKKIAEFEEEQVAKEPSEREPSRVFEVLRTSIDALKEKDLSGFDERETSAIKTLMDINPDSYDKTNESAVKEASSLVRVIDNIVENDDFSNVGAVEPIIKARENLKRAAELVKTKTKEVGLVGKLGANLYQQFTRIFGSSGLASDIQDLMGITDLWNAGSRVENKEIKYSKEISDKIKELKKKYKVDVREIKNSVRLVAYGQLAMNYGDDSHIEKVKGNIQRSAVEHSKADEELGKVWGEVYEEVKDVSTVEEALNLLKTKHPALYEISELNRNKFQSEVNQELARTRAEIHNQPYLEANNYSHIEFDNISNTTDTQEMFMEGANPGRAKVKQKASTTGITATRNLRQGMAYSSDWVENQLRGYRKSLYDIEASPAKALVNQTIYSSQFDELVGGKTNGDLIRKMVLSGEQIQQGVSKNTGNDAVRFLNRLTQFLRNIGAVRALASVSQTVKQPTVLVKTLINHIGSDSLDTFFKGIGAINLISTSPNLRNLFDQYSVGVRGQRLGGIERGDSVSYRMSATATKGFVRVAEHLRGLSDKFTHLSLTPLTKPDVYAARVTWLSYYLQRLKELGVTKVDLNSEFEKQSDPIRKRAAAFAEQMIAETQAPSNPATLAQTIRNENDGGWNFVKNLLIPFSTFSITAKYRNILDVGNFIRNPSRRNASAVAGDVFEIMVYSTVAYLMLPVWKDVIKWGIEDLFGFDSDDDEEKKQELKMRSFYTNLTNAASPFAIGHLGEVGTTTVANGLAYLAQDPNMSYSEWKKETGGFVYEPREFDAGVFALGLEPFVETGKGVISLTTGTASRESFGNTAEVELSDKQQALLALKTFMEMLGTAGIQEADIYNQVKKVYKEQLKEGNKGSSNRPTPRPIPRPRPRPLPAPNLR